MLAMLPATSRKGRGLTAVPGLVDADHRPIRWGGGGLPSCCRPEGEAAAGPRRSAPDLFLLALASRRRRSRRKELEGGDLAPHRLCVR